MSLQYILQKSGIEAGLCQYRCPLQESVMDIGPNLNTANQKRVAVNFFILNVPGPRCDKLIKLIFVFLGIHIFFAWCIKMRMMFQCLSDSANKWVVLLHLCSLFKVIQGTQIIELSSIARKCRSQTCVGKPKDNAVKL